MSETKTHKEKLVGWPFAWVDDQPIEPGTRPFVCVSCGRGDVLVAPESIDRILDQCGPDGWEVMCAECGINEMEAALLRGEEVVNDLASEHDSDDDARHRELLDDPIELIRRGRFAIELAKRRAGE
jgi:hypothetical protein